VWVLQQSLFLATNLREGAAKKDIAINPGFTLTRTTKCELRLWLKANPDSHTTKHQDNKLKNLLKNNFFLENCKSSTYVCACQGGCDFVLEQVPAKGTRCG
jgi:hypothetical protein